MMKRNDSNNQTRRALLKGVAWSTPALIATTTVPTYAASQQTGTGEANLFSEIKTRTPFLCNKDSKPQQGYISTVDSVNDPSVSIGLWFEGAAGSVQVDTAKIQYVFNHPVSLTAAPSGMTWSNPNTLNGWTVSQPSPTVVQFEKNGMTGEVSTATPGTGTNFGGFFQNFKVLDGCFASGVVTVKTVATVVYTDKTGQHTFSKTTTAKGV